MLGLPYTLADLVDVQEAKQINAIITDAHISISVIFDIEYFILILFDKKCVDYFVTRSTDDVVVPLEVYSWIKGLRSEDVAVSSLDWKFVCYHLILICSITILMYSPEDSLQ